MKFRIQHFIFVITVVILIVVVSVITKQQSPATINQQAHITTTYIQKITSGEIHHFLASDKSELLMSSTNLRATKVATIEGMSPSSWQSHNTFLIDNRWLLIIPKTLESNPEARLIDLDKQKAEQRIILPFVQTGNIETSDYGDVLAHGYYDPIQKSVIYLVRKNVMLATEGAGLAEKDSLAELWSQSISGGEPKLLTSFDAKKLEIQSAEIQYELPEIIQPAKQGVFLVWRSKIDRVAFGSNKLEQVFRTTLAKDQTSVFLNLHISPIGTMVISEQQDYAGIGKTILYQLSENLKTAKIQTFAGPTTINTWKLDGSQAVLVSGEDGAISTLDIQTGKQTQFTFSPKDDTIPLFWISDNSLGTTTFSTQNIENGWNTTLGNFDMVKGVTTPIPIQGQYIRL